MSTFEWKTRRWEGLAVSVVEEVGSPGVSITADTFHMSIEEARVGESIRQAGSLIGHATVGAGVGSNPFYVTNGRVYLTGPYKGAPYGLAVVVDAVAGPFDLGRVVVRSAIRVDRTTAQFSTVSDPFPTILKGVPLKIRSVRVAIDKPGFVVAPTNCAEKAVKATVQSTTGDKADVSSRFQVGD